MNNNSQQKRAPRPTSNGLKYLGIDYGSKRVGVAVSDEKGEFAFPYTTLSAGKNLINELRPILGTEHIGAIVIGESRDFKGQANPINADILMFKERLEKEVSLPVFLEAEYWSSAQAERFQGKHDKLDASAAAVILQSYLDKHGK